MDLAHISQQLAEYAQARRIPPLEAWHPPFCGAIDLCIKANGQWWFEGKQMTRKGLIDLFSTVLWYEDNEYFLKTPVEKIGIQVEDVALYIEDVNLVQLNEGSYIECITTHQDKILLTPTHLLQLRPYQDQIKPYVNIRRNLDACILRHAFYHILEWCQLEERNDTITLSIPMGAETQTLTIPNNLFD